MRRGPYREYLRRKEIPIPATTQRRRIENLQRTDDGLENRDQNDVGREGELQHQHRNVVQNRPASQPNQNEVNTNSSILNLDNGSSESCYDSDIGNISSSGNSMSNGFESAASSDDCTSEYDSDEYYLSSEHEVDDEDNSVNAEDFPMPDRVPLYDGCHITLEESRLLIMSFALRFALSDKAIEYLLKVIDCHLPHEKHGSFYKFNNAIPTPPLVQIEFFCSKEHCQRLISFANNVEVVHCECGHECNKDNLYQLGSYFIRLHLKEQLVSLFQDERIRNLLRWEDENESDVISGKFYRTCVNQGIISPSRDLSLQFNTDGVQVFKSSSIQMWPIQVCVNELPFKVRKENMILCGLWYGKGKPNMNTFLKPFVQELNLLHEYGFYFPSSTSTQIIRVHTILSSVDSMARAPMQHLKTFRGAHGCSFCLHPGEEHAIGRGSTRLYRGDLGQPRREDQHRRDVENIIAMDKVPRNFAINGIKGPSVLLMLEVFNIIHSFVPDYLHCVLLGVVKTMFSFWTAGKNSEKLFYIGNDARISEIDNFLLSIKPPCEITRTPRSLHTWKLWRGHEWKNFMLYYSIPCLKAVNVPQRYINHWFLLVYSMHCFLKDKISQESFEKGKVALRRYVLTLEDVYDTAELMKYNTHLLLHIPKSVKDFGGLFGWSTFSFEHYNGMLAKMFRSSQAVPLQICKNYVRLQGLKDEMLNTVQNPLVPDCLKSILASVACGKSTQYIVKDGEHLSVLGAPYFGNLTLVQQNVIENLLNESIRNDHNSVRFYKRLIYKTVLYHVENCQQLTHRINCTFQTNDDRFVSLTHIVKVSTVITSRSHFVLLGFSLHPTGDTLCNNRELGISSDFFVTVVEKSNECVALQANMINRKCLITFFPGNSHKRCCFPLVNLLERD